MTNTTHEIKSQPIGFWAGEAYRHTSHAIRDSLAAEGLTQPQWWMLNHVANGEWTAPALIAKLSPANANEQDLDLEEQMARLIERGWLTRDHEGSLRLTAEGGEGRQQTWQRNGAVHRRMIDGISDAEYDECIRILRRIVGNLGGDSSLH
jgi:hypothetical protein